MKFEVISREDATKKGLHYFFTGKACKWGHISPRYTNAGATYAKRNSEKLYAAVGLCCDCLDMMDSRGGMIGESFEDIMLQWNNSHEDEDTVRLPILSGTSKMGYKVVGESLIDAVWWDDCKTWMWITDHNAYVKASFSRENMRRNRLPPVKGEALYTHLHRFVMGVSGEVNLHVDHINGDKRDNRTRNLRLASITQNSHNSTRGSKTSGKSKYKGVAYHPQKESTRGKANKVWSSQLYRNGSIHVKYCHTEYEAARWYDNILRGRYPSEFNVYNFPLEGEMPAVVED